MTIEHLRSGNRKIFENRNGATKARQDYLMCILELIQNRGYARVADVADILSVSDASASVMVKQLAAEGYLERERYRGFILSRARACQRDSGEAAHTHRVSEIAACPAQSN